MAELKVVWNQRALNHFDRIAEWYSLNLGKQASVKFAKGIKSTLQTLSHSPVHRELSDLFSDACKKQNIYQLIQKATDNADIVLDYFTDTRFQKDEYFQNAYFMNKLGAKTFTKQVLADIGLIKP